MIDDAIWQVEIEERAGRLVLRLRGELDIDTAPKLLAAVQEVLTPGRAVVVDLAELTFVDSSGLGVLVTVWRRAQQVGAQLAVANPTADVAMTLQITGLDQVLPRVELD